MTTERDRDRRRPVRPLLVCAAFLAVPLVMAMTAGDSTSSGAIASAIAVPVAVATPDSGETPDSVAADTSTPDTVPPDTSGPATTTPGTGGDTTPPGTEVPDDDQGDPTAVTIAAIIGAALLLGVAIAWMVHMNRSNDGRPDDQTDPPPVAPGPPDAW